MRNLFISVALTISSSLLLCSSCNQTASRVDERVIHGVWRLDSIYAKNSVGIELSGNQLPHWTKTIIEQAYLEFKPNGKYAARDGMGFVYKCQWEIIGGKFLEVSKGIKVWNKERLIELTPQQLILQTLPNVMPDGNQYTYIYHPVQAFPNPLYGSWEINGVRYNKDSLEVETKNVLIDYVQSTDDVNLILMPGRYEFVPERPFNDGFKTIGSLSTENGSILIFDNVQFNYSVNDSQLVLTETTGIDNMEFQMQFGRVKENFSRYTYDSLITFLKGSWVLAELEVIGTDSLDVSLQERYSSLRGGSQEMTIEFNDDGSSQIRFIDLASNKVLSKTNSEWALNRNGNKIYLLDSDFFQYGMKIEFPAENNSPYEDYFDIWSFKESELLRLKMIKQ